ncbi:MAG: MBL fold metallo-hydrolase [Hyphomonas sp.]|nr:MBL fold metallo-hydrolase [Hyphomonas sp.]
MAGYRDGVHDLGNGALAYMQDCNQGSGWGWSNSGLITDHEESVLIDTLRDEKLTQTMLNKYRDATGLAARDIGTLVNTHRDADHTFGNRLMEHARIVAAEACAQGMRELNPDVMIRLLENRPEGVVGDYILQLFGPPFDFTGVKPAMPTDTFTGRKDLKVGDKTVHLIEVGPAHTGGDILVHVPDNRLVYTGDIVFLTNTPIIWSGPHENWIAAIDMLLEMDVDTYVPGHGPVTDKKGVAKVKDYLVHVEKESRARFEAGMDVMDAIQDIALGEFEDWGGAERIVANVLYFYRRFTNDPTPINVPDAIRLMAPYAERARKRAGAATPAAPSGSCCPH